MNFKYCNESKYLAFFFYISLPILIILRHQDQRIRNNVFYNSIITLNFKECELEVI